MKKFNLEKYDIKNFNLEEYKIMTNYLFEKDEDYIDKYLNEDINKFSDIENIRVNTKNISEFLINITDKEKYDMKTIYNNLKNCLYGRKGCVFSVGYNIYEHKDRFNELTQEYTKCCWKSSINFLENKCDILGIGNNINGNYINKFETFSVLFSEYHTKRYNDYLKKINLCIYEEGCDFINTKSKLFFNFKNICIQNFKHCSIYGFIVFLNYLGLNDLYLFGWYLDECMLDIRNYNYDKDIICKKFHYYDAHNTRTKEPGLFLDHINSYYLHDYMIYNSIKIYNVSIIGSISNRIPRIDFNDIFNSKKNVIKPKYEFEDFIIQYKKYFDEEFYKTKYKTNDPLQHYITKGLYLNNNINKYCNKKNIIMNNFTENLFYYISIIKKYPPPLPKSCFTIYFAHYHAEFKNLFNLDIYEKLHFNEKDFINFLNDDNFKNKKDYIKNNLDIFINLNLNNDNINLINNDIFYLLIYKYYNKFIDFDFPKDFNVQEYKELNKDLKNMTDTQAKVHFCNHGYKENRKYKFN